MEPILVENLYDDSTPELTKFEPLPAGPHLLEVITVKAGTASTGRQRLGLQVKIVGGAAADKKGWHNLNFPKPGEPTDGYINKLWRKIGELAPDAVKPMGKGLFSVDPEGLVGLQFRANVLIKKQDDGSERNEFKNETWLGFPQTAAAGPGTFETPPA